MTKKVAVLCGLAQEAAILKDDPNLDVYCGTDGAMAITEYAKHYAGLLSFGTAGALATSVRVGDVMVATSVLDGMDRYAVDIAWWGKLLRDPGCIIGRALSLGKTAASTPAQRHAYVLRYGCKIIDEESGVVARLAKTYRLPFAVVRGVSDNAAQTVPDAALHDTDAKGDSSILPVVESLAENPAQLPELLQLDSTFNTAIAALRAYYLTNRAAFSME